ncbi:hypothetical protein YC2023_017219 [Brassica napus]
MTFVQKLNFRRFSCHHDLSTDPNLLLRYCVQLQLSFVDFNNIELIKSRIKAHIIFERRGRDYLGAEGVSSVGRSGVTATIGVRDCWLGSDSWVVGAVCIFAGALSVDLTWYHGEEEESVWTGVDLLSRLFKSRCDFFPADLHCWVSC